MTRKFKGKYRITSHRKPKWDYSAEALYFITIVTQKRVCNLGEIGKKTDGTYQIELSEFGKIVAEEWGKSFEIRTELVLHTYVIMPNHIHAIVEIRHPDANYNQNNAGIALPAVPAQTHGRGPLRPAQTHGRGPQRPAQTHGRVSLLRDEPRGTTRKPPVRLPKSISSFLAGFKSAVNSKIDDYIDQHQLNIPKYNRNNHFFQPNYHDFIIRNPKQYWRIKKYIINNPKKWYMDTNGRRTQP